MSIAQRMKKHRKQLRALADIAESRVFLMLTQDGKQIDLGENGDSISIANKPTDLLDDEYKSIPVYGLSKKAFLQELTSQLIQVDIDYLYLVDRVDLLESKAVPLTTYTATPSDQEKCRKTGQNCILTDAFRQVLNWGCNPDEERLIRMTPDSELLKVLEIKNLPDFDLDVIEATDLLDGEDCKFIAVTSHLGSNPFKLAVGRFKGWDKYDYHSLEKVPKVLQSIADQKDLDFVLVDGGILPLSMKGAEIADAEIGLPPGVGKTWVEKTNEVGELNVRLQGLRTLASLFGVETEITVLDTAAQHPGTTVSDQGFDPVSANPT